MNSIDGKAALKSSTMRKLLLNVSVVLIMLFSTAVLLATAELVARVSIGNAVPAYKIFPEFSRAIYKTTEFDCVANINRFGFRGLENRLLPGQVAVIGDSYAFGWGVSDDETWPKMLQDDLSNTSTPSKVYNLGRPGADPDDYLDIARAYVPVLKPKLLIVSLLQDDDLEQLLQKRDRKTDSHEYGSAARSISSMTLAMFPGLTAAARSILHPTIMATSTWKADVLFRIQHGEFFKAFNNRLAMLPSDIRKATETGNLNPALISSVAESPEAFVAPYEEPEVSWLVARIFSILVQLKALVESNGGKLVLLSMPHGAYFPSETRENFGRMGFQLPSLPFDKPDEFAAKLAEKARVQSILLAHKLLLRNDLSELWYKLDGHPTRHGTEVLEKYIFEAMPGVMAQGREP